MVIYLLILYKDVVLRRHITVKPAVLLRSVPVAVMLCYVQSLLCCYHGVQQVVYGYSNVPLFGYSLIGGVDLDNNRYPDLMIGGVSTSANSDVTLLR